jgi:hypothetical protein
MKKIALVFFVILLASAITCFASGNVLSRDYPYSVVFVQMATKGIFDHAVQFQQFPATLADTEAAGFFPYRLPELTALDYQSGGKWASVSTQGRPVIINGQYTDPLYQEYNKLPSTELYHLEESPEYEQTPGGELELVTRERKMYSWRGAQWLDEGYSWDEVARGLRASRLRIVLHWATQMYVYDYGQPPADLADLEEYIGAERSPAGWQGITLASSPEEMAAIPGSLFVGWDADGNWQVSANFGPQTRYCTWYADKSWLVNPNSTLY